MKWLKYLIVASGVLLIAQLTSASNAYAASDYDDIIQPISSLRLKYAGLDDVDITNNYMGYFRSTVTDNVGHYECQENEDSSTDPTDCNQIINDSLDNGDWLVTQSYSSYPVDNTSVEGQFCDKKITSVEGNSPFPTVHNLYGNTSSSANCVRVSIRYQPYYSGIHLTVLGHINRDVSHYAIAIGSEYTSGGIWYSDDSQYLFTASPTYPEGYEGDFPPSDYTPVTTTHTGTIDCGGAMPVAMSIYQPGNSGAATMTQLSLGRAQWSYDFTSDPYSFTVDCGDGKLATPYGSVDPATVSNDWMCDIQSTEPYHCTLS